MRGFLILAIGVVAGCSMRPFGVSESAWTWDQNVTARQDVHWQSVDELPAALLERFRYEKDYENEWRLPEKKTDRWHGDCEDFAIWTAAHLKAQGIPSRIVTGERFEIEGILGQKVRRGHAMLQLKDGRFIDNRHKKPFEKHEYTIRWTSGWL